MGSILHDFLILATRMIVSRPFCLMLETGPLQYSRVGEIDRVSVDTESSFYRKKAGLT